MSRAAAMKLIHLTDPHLVASGLLLYGLDPLARLDAAIADINAHHADAELAVVTGDLTHAGEPDAYRAFRESMAALRIPHVALVGNHDRRTACLELLPAAPRDADGFVQGTHDTRLGRLVFLDTLNEGSDAGQMCPQRLAWLARTLAETPSDLPIFFFMHHPPFGIGIPDMDRIALVEHAQMAGIVRPYRCRIRHLFYGHVHRPVSGNWMGISCSTLRGTNHQVWSNLAPGCLHLASHEPPAYGIVLVDNDSVAVHTRDYLDDSSRFPF